MIASNQLLLLVDEMSLKDPKQAFSDSHTQHRAAHLWSPKYLGIFFFFYQKQISSPVGIRWGVIWFTSNTSVWRQRPVPLVKAHSHRIGPTVRGQLALLTTWLLLASDSIATILFGSLLEFSRVAQRTKGTILITSITNKPAEARQKRNVEQSGWEEASMLQGPSHQATHESTNTVPWSFCGDLTG